MLIVAIQSGPKKLQHHTTNDRANVCGNNFPTYLLSITYQSYGLLCSAQGIAFEDDVL